MMDHENNVQPIKPRDGLSKEEVYIREQKSAISGIKVGDNCPLGSMVTKIFARGDEYVVYEIDSKSPIESIKVYIHTKVEDNEEPLNNFQKAKDRFDKIKSIIFKYGADSSYKQRTASAVVAAIRGDILEAERIFSNIENDAESDFKKRVYGRVFYLLGALILSALTCCFALLAYIHRESAILAQNSGLLIFIYSSAYAAMGGLFSVSLKAKDVWVQQVISDWMYSIYGAERLIISIIAGLLSCTAMKAGLIFSFAEINGSASYFMLSVCFVSGFSESLVPNYMGKLEKEA
ncbi:hypothetical protein D3C78_968190 [compost metagenome]